MGALNITRVLTEALIAGYKWDTNGETLKWLPQVDNSGTLQVGDGTTDIDVKVHTGSEDGYFLIDTSANTVQCNSDFKVNFSSGSLLVDASANTVTINGRLQYYKQRHRIIITAGTVVLNSTDFGKVILSATNDKFLTLPDPVGNAGATFEIIQVITRNTVLQSVNATAGRFGWDGDNAVNSIRINSAGDWVKLVSNDLDWYVGNLGANTSNIVPNVNTSF